MYIGARRWSDGVPTSLTRQERTFFIPALRRRDQGVLGSPYVRLFSEDVSSVTSSSRPASAYRRAPPSVMTYTAARTWSSVSR